MPTPSSPNAISLNDVNVELGNAGTAQISLNDTALRKLFGETTGTVDMNTGRGKYKNVVATGGTIYTSGCRWRWWCR